MKKIKNITFCILCAVFLNIQVSYATIDTGLGQGLGGAEINNVQGGFAGLNKGVNSANLNFDGNSIVNWNKLNVNKNETLNFNAVNGAKDLTVLNTVNQGMTKVYGAINANNGISNLIISNPNGVLFDGSRFTAAGDVTISTQNMSNITLKDLQNNDFSKAQFTKVYDQYGKQVGIEMKDATIQVAGKYNIVTPGMKISIGSEQKLVTDNGQDYLEFHGNHCCHHRHAVENNGNVVIVDGDGQNISSHNHNGHHPHHGNNGHGDFHNHYGQNNRQISNNHSYNNNGHREFNHNHANDHGHGNNNYNNNFNHHNNHIANHNHDRHNNYNNNHNFNHNNGYNHRNSDIVVKKDYFDKSDFENKPINHGHGYYNQNNHISDNHSHGNNNYHNHDNFNNNHNNHISDNHVHGNNNYHNHDNFNNNHHFNGHDNCNNNPVINTQDNLKLSEKYYVRALQKYMMGDLEGSKADLSKSIQNNVENADAYYYRAAINKQLGNMNDFEADYTKAVSLNPYFINSKFSNYVANAH